MPRRRSAPGPGPSSPIAKAASIVQRAVAKRNLWFFLTVGAHLDLDPEYHGEWVEQLQRDDWDEMLVLAARGHYKTHVVAGYHAWDICRDRNTVQLVTAVNDAKGTEIVNLTRQILELPEIEQWFGTFQSDIWSTERIIVSGRTGRPIREATLYSMGIGAFRPGGHHNLLTFEDVEDQERVASQEVMEQTRRTDDLAYPMADRPNSRRLTTGTFYSADDLYHHKAEQMGVLSKDENGMAFFKRGVTRNGRNVLLFLPAENEDGSFAFKAIAAETAKNKAKMSPYEYALQYKLDILGNADAPFQKRDFVYTDEGSMVVETFIGLDAARSQKKGSDHTGRVVVEIDEQAHWHVTEALRERLDGDRLIEQFVAYAYAYPNALWAVELDPYMAGLKGQIEQRLRTERLFPRITWISSHARPRKEARILALQGLFRSKAITLSTTGTRALEEELLPFPGPGRRDVADALANVLEIARTPNGDVTPAKRPKLTPETMWIHQLLDDEKIRKQNDRVNPYGARRDWRAI